MDELEREQPFEAVGLHLCRPQCWARARRSLGRGHAGQGVQPHSSLLSVLKPDSMHWPQSGQQSKYAERKPLDEELYNTQVNSALQRDKPRSLSEFVHTLERISKQTAKDKRVRNKKVVSSYDMNFGN